MNVLVDLRVGAILRLAEVLSAFLGGLCYVE
jgi:hypothetical protein